MSRGTVAAALATLAAAICAAPAWAAGVDRSELHFGRTLTGGERRPVLLRPDGSLFAHSRPGFADLRILDARGREVAWRPAPIGRPEARVRRPARSVSRMERGSETVVTIDLAYRNIDVDRLRVAALTPRYDRPATILGSNDGLRFATLARVGLYRFGGAQTPSIPLSAHFRYLRIEIANGDDPPLRGISVSARGDSDSLLVEGGHPGPYLALYGDPRAEPPDYDFGRMPVDPAALRRVAVARLGPELRNPRFEPVRPRPDTRSFVARHEGIVGAVLAAVALALGLVGALALRGPRVSV